MTIADPTITAAAALAQLSSLCPFAIRGLAKLVDSSEEECLEQIEKLGFIALFELKALGAVEFSTASINDRKTDRYTFTDFFHEMVLCAHSSAA
jgi:hypothetical protein